MNKTELILSIQNKVKGDYSKAVVEDFLNTTLDCIKAGLKKEGEVQLVGFGGFRVTKLAARDGINPQTGDKIRIKASRTVKFKPGAPLKAAV